MSQSTITPTPDVLDDFLRKQLLTRRERLELAVSSGRHHAHLHRLLDEVDTALAKFDEGSYGICEECHDPIECDRLIADPLVRVCLDHLSKSERSALEQDLQLAAQVQKALLPPQDFVHRGWHMSYRYEPARLVSGDYCDVIENGDDGLYFMVGDVSGKGVAASMLTAHLHAMFRSLIPIGMSLECMLEHASRVFSESTLPTQYATLVVGRALPDGRVQICNAGHPPPLIAREDDVIALDSAGLPVGMFAQEEFSISEIRLEPGHRLLVYSDGVSEATDSSGREYGSERIRYVLNGKCRLTPAELVALCHNDLQEFCGGASKADDITLFVLGRVHGLS